MKWIGQHIWDFVSRFRNDVYLENLTELDQEFSVMIDADGKLTKSTHPGERSRIQVRNDEGSTIPAGAPLYSKGEIGGSERIKVGICLSSDPAKMPCIGIAEFEMNTTSTKDSFAVTQGVYNTNISGFTGLSIGDTLYVNGGVAPHLTQTKPTNGDLIQNVGIVLKTNGTICQGLLVSAIGRTNDVPWPLYVDHTTQRVGIGTASPDHKFHIEFTNGDTSFSGGGLGNWGSDGIRIENASSIVDTMAMLQFRNADADIHIAGIRQGTNDSDLGFFFEGSEKMRIDSSGKVGIGTTSPNKNFTVEWLSNNTVVDSGEGLGGGTAGSGVLIQNGSYVANTYANLDFRAGNADGRIAYKYNSINDGDFHFITDNGNNPETKLFIENNGNVGIGTTSPSQKLHVVGDARIQGNLTVNGTYTQIDTDVNTTEQWLVTNDGTGPAAVINQLGTEDIFDVQDDGTSVFYIEDGGNIGVGTTSPGATLHISDASNSGVTSLSVNDRVKVRGDGVVEWGSAANYGLLSWDTNQARIGASSGSNLAIFSNGSEKMRIDTSGNVGIGTTGPSHKLDVDGGAQFNTNTGATPFYITRLGSTDQALSIKVMDDNVRFESIQDETADNYGGFDFRMDGGTTEPDFVVRKNAGDPILNVKGNGNVGIGTTSPSQKLHVYGKIKLEEANGGTVLSGNYGYFKVSPTNNYGVLVENSLDAAKYFSFGVPGDYGQIRYKENNSSAISVSATGVGIGTTSPSEKLEVNGSIKVGDGEYVYLGDDNDLRLIHSSNGFIQNFTGNLYIENGGDDKDIIFNCDDGSGSVTEYFRVDGGVGYMVASKAIRALDSVNLQLGTSADFTMQHNGVNTILQNFNGNLEITQGADDGDIVFSSDDGSGGTETYFYLDGGNNNVVFQKDIVFVDNEKAIFGVGSDLQIYHNGTDSVIDNIAGDFYISQKAADKDLIFRADDGAGGVAAYLTLDGGLGFTTLQKNLRANDDVRILVGSGQDAEFFHDGANTSIRNTTGDLQIRQAATDKDIIFQADDGSGGETEYLRIDGGDGGIKFYKDISNQANANLVMGGGQIKFSDAGRFYAGDSNDLQIYHDGSHSYIKDTGTGNLRIDASDFYVRNSGGTKIAIDALDGAEVALRYDGSRKLETTSTGVDVTGNVQADSYKISGATILSGNTNVSLGSSGATGTISLNTHTSTALYVAGDDNVGIGNTSPSEKLEVTGNIAVSGSVQRQISTTHHTFTFGAAGSAAQDYWIPFIGNSELASPNVTHRTIAPYTGILKKAIVHSTIAYGSSAQVRFHRIDNGTTSVFVNDNSTDDVTTNVTADMSTAYSSVAFDFTTGNTFSAGDQIGVSFVRNNTGLGDVAITLVWEYELF